jgi:RNA polymerase sigma-54 factor
MVFRLAPNAAEGPLIVEVYAPLAGRLRVNPEIRALVKTLDGAEKENWEGKVEEAALVEKCLRQSQNTILRLAAILAEEQRSFILGSDRELIPMTRARIAERLAVHESTISRAVSRKRAALPSGRIVPLSKFFDRSLSVRDVVRSIIAEENRPLTDTEVAGMLKERGIPVARRTVAKYRAMEGILPAALRSTQRAQRGAALSAS